MTAQESMRLYGQEFWYARKLQIALESKQLRRFENVIENTKEACKNSQNSVVGHFVNIGKMADIGSNA